MPEPPGGRGQKSIFAFPGFKKYVEVRGVLHEVVPPALDDFDAKHPLLCRWGCGERFSRGTAKASHERHCKKQCSAEEEEEADSSDADKSSDEDSNEDSDEESYELPDEDSDEEV